MNNEQKKVLAARGHCDIEAQQIITKGDNGDDKRAIVNSLDDNLTGIDKTQSAGVVAEHPNDANVSAAKNKQSQVWNEKQVWLDRRTRLSRNEINEIAPVAAAREPTLREQRQQIIDQERLRATESKNTSEHAAVAIPYSFSAVKTKTVHEPVSVTEKDSMKVHPDKMNRRTCLYKMPDADHQRDLSVEFDSIEIPFPFHLQVVSHSLPDGAPSLPDDAAPMCSTANDESVCRNHDLDRGEDDDDEDVDDNNVPSGQVVVDHVNTMHRLTELQNIFAIAQMVSVVKENITSAHSSDGFLGKKLLAKAVLGSLLLATLIIVTVVLVIMTNDPTQPNTTQLNPRQLNPTCPNKTHPNKTHPIPTHPNKTHPNTTHPNTTHPNTTHPNTTHRNTTHCNTTHPNTKHPNKTHPNKTQPIAPTTQLRNIPDAAFLRHLITEYLANNNNDMDVAKEFGWPIGTWCISPVRNFSYLFWYDYQDWGTFNEPLNEWDVSNGKTFTSMFSNCVCFNQNLSM